MYQTTFLDFRYEPHNFVYVEIGTSNRIPATPSVVQPIAITNPFSPLRGGIGLEIIPLPIQTFHYLSHVQ